LDLQFLAECSQHHISHTNVSVLFVLITRLSYGKKKLAYLLAHHEELMEKERKVEKQNIDPELEYEDSSCSYPK